MLVICLWLQNTSASLSVEVSSSESVDPAKSISSRSKREDHKHRRKYADYSDDVVSSIHKSGRGLIYDPREIFVIR